MKVWVRQFGLWSPWFANAKEFAGFVTSEAANNPQSLPEPNNKTPRPELIPRNERRRAPVSVRIAVEAASEAMQNTELSATDVASVFAFGQGDTDITDYMCRALATEEKALSPTKFHNSVHNAASGYWTISSDCMQASNSISAFDQSASLGLLEAACQVSIENRPVLLCCYDIAPDPILQFPLYSEQAFACALLLVPETSRVDGDACLEIEPGTGHYDWSACSLRTLEALYKSNPAARCLPILQALLSPEPEFEGQMPTGSNSGFNYRLAGAC